MFFIILMAAIFATMISITDFIQDIIHLSNEVKLLNYYLQRLERLEIAVQRLRHSQIDARFVLDRLVKRERERDLHRWGTLEYGNTTGRVRCVGVGYETEETEESSEYSLEDEEISEDEDDDEDSGDEDDNNEETSESDSA
ncbi:hypothetical protein TWF730_006307 [Orbilia blumenaviensis]|uniref:Uncharacterized protein n=1 Tax=Orbilia blumenaviensis TaxID=1796055 RepID=A0AAV9VG74_9PEZI